MQKSYLFLNGLTKQNQKHNRGLIRSHIKWSLGRYYDCPKEPTFSWYGEVGHLTATATNSIKKKQQNNRYALIVYVCTLFNVKDVYYIWNGKCWWQLFYEICCRTQQWNISWNSYHMILWNTTSPFPANRFDYQQLFGKGA